MPIVLGGGHETAFGHFLGYAAAHRRSASSISTPTSTFGPATATTATAARRFARPWSIRPAAAGARTMSASVPSRTASAGPIWLYAREHGCVVRWAGKVRDHLAEVFGKERDRLAAAGSAVYLSIDADVVRASDVPGVSAPNPLGLSGAEVVALARLAGQSPAVASLDVVEINPRHDRDGQSARWAALVVWNFLAGLALRAENPAGIALK